MADPLKVYRVQLMPGKEIKMIFSQRAMRLAKGSFAKIYGKPLGVDVLLNNFDTDICGEFAAAASIANGETAYAWTPDKIGEAIDNNPECYTALAMAVLEGVRASYNRLTSKEEAKQGEGSAPAPTTESTGATKTPGSDGPTSVG